MDRCPVEAIARAFQRLLDYPPWQVGLELALIWLLVFVAYRFIKGTRAAGAFKGVLVVLVVATLGLRLIDQAGVLPRIGALYDKVLGLAALALLITFQPELRRAFIRLGETPFLRSSRDDVRDMAQAVARSAGFLSKSKFGAVVAIERNVGLRDFAESGRVLNADVNESLLNSIFWPSSPLHDMGVVIRGNKILAAAVQFPLAQPAEMPLTHLGTRHRAAVGLSKRTDALVVVVSEETGTISLAEDGSLKRSLTPEQLEELIVEKLAGTARPGAEQDVDDPEGDALQKQIESEMAGDEDAAVSAVAGSSAPPDRGASGTPNPKTASERRARTRGGAASDSKPAETRADG